MKKKTKASSKKRQRKPILYLEPDSDETFAFIAGYTDWGFPYGITWEENEMLSNEYSLFSTMPLEERLVYCEDPESE
jgi:hypothetical protein